MHNTNGLGDLRYMSDYKFKQVDFDNPSFLFVIEDIFKSFIGCPLFYNPYIKSFGLKGDENVLDFGCGSGSGSRCLLKFLNENGHLTCIDTSSYWMTKAERRLSKYANVECILGDIRELPIPDGSYNVISIFHVIHDIEPVKRKDTVNVLSQKLKTNGILFIREPIKKSHGIAVNEIQTLFSDAGLGEVEHVENKSEYKGKFLK
jgi:ubiquinone/menaquinone biosynthesis C-methylase UbiE